MSDTPVDTAGTEPVQDADVMPPDTASPDAASPEARALVDQTPTYDFRRSRAFAPERMRSLEAMYGGLCKSLERWLTTRVREPVALEVGEFRSLPLEAHAASMSTPTAAFLFQIDKAGRQAIIDFGRPFGFYLVDRLLGSNDPPRQPERSLTVLERMLVRMPAEQVAAQLAAIWKDEAKLEPQLTRFEAQPAMLQAGKRDEMLLVASISVKAGALGGSFTIALPQMAVEPFFAPPAPQRAPLSPPPLMPPGAERSLRDVEMGVCVRTAPFSIRLGELTRLIPGCMLETGLPTSSELTVRVEGIARFQALAGRSGPRLAARITQVLAPAQQMALETKGRTVPMASITSDNENSGASAFAELTGSQGDAASSLSTLYQVSLPITIELGRTRMSVQDILALARGSVIELDRLIGEPVDVMVGDRYFANGEVVVVGEHFGVRITRVVEAAPKTPETP